MKTRFSTLKISLSFSAILAVAVMLVACNRNSSDNSGAIPPGFNPNANGCAAGTYYNGGYCYNANGTTAGTYNGINFITDNYQYRNFTVKDSGAYSNFLKKAMGVCDRTQTTGGIYACSSWTSGYSQVVLQTQTGASNHLYATFSAYPYSSSNYNWGVQLPSMGDFFLGLIGFPTLYDYGSAIKNPLTIDAVVSVINQNKGFEARGYGDFYTTANTSLIQIVIPVGKLEDAQFDYQLAFEGVVFATGRFVRY